MLTENYCLSVNWWQRITVLRRKVKGFTPRDHFHGEDLVGV